MLPTFYLFTSLCTEAQKLFGTACLVVDVKSPGHNIIKLNFYHFFHVLWHSKPHNDTKEYGCNKISKIGHNDVKLRGLW